ncbi:MAG TPA: R3H domain-containing nucleic acid-binding protein [Polyangiaceae bacterium]|nr:R3H domain-containing nucleic acid-binding protein [Polyangiaceae bacterium]
MNEPNDDVTVDGGWDDEDETEDAGEGEGGSEGNGAAAENADAAATNGEQKPRRNRKPRDEGPPWEPDERAQQALEFVMNVLDEMEMDCEVELRRPKQDDPLEIQLEINGRDSGRIIGKKGQVLGALQYLTNRVVNRPGLEKRYVTVDAEGYRSRRDDTLASMAKRLGKQAVTEGKIITFEPMNPRDRRVIHLALAKFEGVVTKSEGEGEDRRVQIIPVRR